MEEGERYDSCVDVRNNDNSRQKRRYRPMVRTVRDERE